jgi:hypothetical protein
MPAKPQRWAEVRSRVRTKQRMRRAKAAEKPAKAKVTVLHAVGDGKRRSLPEAMRHVGADECWLATHYRETADQLAEGKPSRLLLDALRECAKNLEGGMRAKKNGEGDVFEIVHCVSRPELFKGKTAPAESDSVQTEV